MAATWTAGIDKSAGDDITATIWNNLLGANGSLNFVNSALSANQTFLLKSAQREDSNVTINTWYSCLSIATAGYLLSVCGSRSGTTAGASMWTGDGVEVQVNIDGHGMQDLSGIGLGSDQFALDDVTVGYDPDNNQSYSARRLECRVGFTTSCVVELRNTTSAGSSVNLASQAVYAEEKKL